MQIFLLHLILMKCNSSGGYLFNLLERSYLSAFWTKIALGQAQHTLGMESIGQGNFVQKAPNMTVPCYGVSFYNEIEQ
jgi:hypothetical protein